MANSHFLKFWGNSLLMILLEAIDFFQARDLRKIKLYFLQPHFFLWHQYDDGMRYWNGHTTDVALGMAISLGSSLLVPTEISKQLHMMDCHEFCTDIRFLPRRRILTTCPDFFSERNQLPLEISCEISHYLKYWLP